MLEPPVFNSQEEADAYLDAQKDLFSKERLVGGTVGVAEGLGLVDLFAGVPWLVKKEFPDAAFAPLMSNPIALNILSKDKEKDKLIRTMKVSQGLLGDEKSRKKLDERINMSESKTYDEAIENSLESLGYNKTEKSEVARQVAFLTTLGIDLAFLTKVIIQNAPRGYRAVRDALKNMGKNVDEADQAVMKAEMETGFSETPVQMEMDLAAPKAKPVQNTQEQVYNLETRLYDLNNVIRQEGGVMSKTNLQKINKEINEIQSKLNKLQGYKNGGIVQNSVDYALEQWT
jgi:polyhydroxyalkanoate synthesis regulator phasin